MNKTKGQYNCTCVSILCRWYNNEIFDYMINDIIDFQSIEPSKCGCHLISRKIYMDNITVNVLIILSNE